MNNIDNRTFKWAAVILGFGLVVSTVIGAYTFYRVRALDDVLSVTGSAKQAVAADQVKWITAINRPSTASTLKSGYAQLASDLATVTSFYAAHGLASSSLQISPVYMDEVYISNPLPNQEKQYTLRQTIQINSSDVAGITALSKDTSSLISSGVIFSTQSLEYYYSKLADLRVSLLTQAVSDAKARATQLVAGTGKTVGKLKTASSGVVQVLPENSVEVSDYGAYDTSSIQKDVMVTVKAVFTLN